LLVTLALSLTGCVSPGTKAQVEVIHENRKAIDRNTTAVIASGLAAVTGTTAPLDNAAAKIGEENASADSRFEKLRTDLEKQQLEFRTFVTGALQIAGDVATDLVPGGSAAARALGLIKSRVDAAQNSANQAQKEGEAAKKDAATATVEAQKLVTNLKTELAAKEELLKQQIAAREALQKKDLEFALKELSSLNAQQKAELHQELLTLAKDRGIKGAEGMTTEQHLTALGGAGLGLAGLLRTFGRSRSAAKVDEIGSTQDGHEQKLTQTATEVDEIWTEVKALQSKVALAENQLERCDCSTLRANLSGHSSTLANHERRLDNLEA
jgi:hypothetical protein